MGEQEKKIGRLKRKLELIEKHVGVLEAQLRAYEQVMRTNEAIVTAMLVAAGADAGKPLTVKREVVDRALAQTGAYQRARILIEPESGDYVMNYDDLRTAQEVSSDSETGAE